MRSTLGTQRWAPWWIPVALGSWFGVGGWPRCPGAAIDATAALSWRRAERWGPAQLRLEQRNLWAAAVDWALSPRYVAASPWPVPALRREGETLALAADASVDLHGLRLAAPLARAL